MPQTTQTKNKSVIGENRATGVSRHRGLSVHQNIFIDHTVRNAGVRACISSPTEYEFRKEVFDHLGLVEGKDYYHQWCFHNESMVIVVDFFLPKHKLVVELDGKEHQRADQSTFDVLRDRVCKANGMNTLRIKMPLDGSKIRFWRLFFHEVFEEDAEKL